MILDTCHGAIFQQEPGNVVKRFCRLIIRVNSLKAPKDWVFVNTGRCALLRDGRWVYPEKPMSTEGETQYAGYEHIEKVHFDSRAV